VSAKVERLVNLTIALLETRKPLTFAELRARTGYYGQADPESARRMFERDKDDLRRLGVPIETRPVPLAAEDGYLVDRRHLRAAGRRPHQRGGGGARAGGPADGGAWQPGAREAGGPGAGPGRPRGRPRYAGRGGAAGGGGDRGRGRRPRADPVPLPAGARGRGDPLRSIRTPSCSDAAPGTSSVATTTVTPCAPSASTASRGRDRHGPGRRVRAAERPRPRSRRRRAPTPARWSPTWRSRRRPAGRWRPGAPRRRGRTRRPGGARLRVDPVRDLPWLLGLSTEVAVLRPPALRDRLVAALTGSPRGRGGRRRGGVVSATADVARMLALVPWLLERPGASVVETAETFGVDAATIERDLGHLDFCGLPGLGGGDLFDVSLVGDRIVVQLADELRRPVRPTPVGGAAARAHPGRGRAHPRRRAAGAAHRRRQGAPGARGARRRGRGGRTCVDRAGAGPAAGTRRRPAGAAALPGARVGGGQQPRGRPPGAARPRRRLVPAGARPRGRGVARLPPRPGGRPGGARPARTAEVPVDLPPPRYRPGPDDLEVVLDLAPGARWVADAVVADRLEPRADGWAR
jgi:hypothetical protein